MRVLNRYGDGGMICKPDKSSLPLLCGIYHVSIPVLKTDQHSLGAMPRADDGSCCQPWGLVAALSPAGRVYHHLYIRISGRLALIAWERFLVVMYLSSGTGGFETRSTAVGAVWSEEAENVGSGVRLAGPVVSENRCMYHTTKCTWSQSHAAVQFRTGSSEVLGCTE